MQISNITSQKNSFGQWCVTGKDSDNYKKLLAPYKDKLDKITNGYDVTIEEEKGPFEVYDGFFNEYHSIYDIPTVTIEPSNSSQRIIPKTKLYVYPGAGEMQSKSAQAHEMIDVIKKGISIYA